MGQPLVAISPPYFYMYPRLSKKRSKTSYGYYYCSIVLRTIVPFFLSFPLLPLGHHRSQSHKYYFQVKEKSELSYLALTVFPRIGDLNLGSSTGLPSQKGSPENICNRNLQKDSWNLDKTDLTINS